MRSRRSTSSQVQGRQTPQLTQRINTQLTVAAKQSSRCIAFFFRKIQHRHLFVTGALPTDSRLRISTSSFSGKAHASQTLSVGRSHAARRISRLTRCFASLGGICDRAQRHQRSKQRRTYKQSEEQSIHLSPGENFKVYSSRLSVAIQQAFCPPSVQLAVIHV